MSAVDPEFAEFVGTVQVPLERLARRLAPPGTDPYDLAAETLARVFARWDSLGEVEDKRAWTLRVATNLAYSARSMETRRTRILGRRQVAPEARRFEDTVADRDVLRPALLKLPRRQRVAVALRYLADLPLEEVAKTMGVSTETAKTHLERGRAALRNALGVDLPAARRPATGGDE
ncbi:MAG TPA: sigma-70 family RNA polymerase sigma factor [Acidimicrobiales bacterium]|nr:sigma-70 family RNA polymerase sigma factor [Acidimicrobiales bacterium]